MARTTKPDWWDQGKVYYSNVDWRQRGYPANVFIPPDGNITDSTPGTLCLQLDRQQSGVRVRDADGRERGIIRSEGFVPGIKDVMRRNGTPIWVLSVRSVVRKRHALQLGDARWTFDTPFFWRRDFTGVTCGSPKLVGFVGPTTRLWLIAIAPEWDSLDLLTAAAFMHRNWVRW